MTVLTAEHRRVLVDALAHRRPARGDLVAELVGLGLVVDGKGDVPALTPDGRVVARVCLDLHRAQVWDQCADELVDRAIRAGLDYRRKRWARWARRARARARDAHARMRRRAS